MALHPLLPNTASSPTWPLAIVHAYVTGSRPTTPRLHRITPISTSATANHFLTSHHHPTTAVSSTSLYGQQHRLHPTPHPLHLQQPGLCRHSETTPVSRISPQSHRTLKMVDPLKSISCAQLLLTSLTLLITLSITLHTTCASVILIYPQLFCFNRCFSPTRLSALPMDLESPDWERSPSLIEEVHTDPYTAPAVKQEEIKLEDVKLEDVEHEDTTTTLAVLPTPPASASSTLPPPPKTPPILPPSHRNRSVRTTAHTPQQPRPNIRQADNKPPPSPSTSTSSEDPVILTTKSQYYRNHVPGNRPIDFLHRLTLHPHPSFPHLPLLARSPILLPATSVPLQYLHTAKHKSGFPDHAATAKSCRSTFRTTSSNTLIQPTHPPLLHFALHLLTLTTLTPLSQTPQRHHVLHHQQPFALPPLRHHHNWHHQHFFHHFLPFPTSYISQTSKLTTSPTPFYGSPAVQPQQPPRI